MRDRFEKGAGQMFNLLFLGGLDERSGSVTRLTATAVLGAAPLFWELGDGP